MDKQELLDMWKKANTKEKDKRTVPLEETDYLENRREFLNFRFYIHKLRIKYQEKSQNQLLDIKVNCQNRTY